MRIRSLLAVFVAPLLAVLVACGGDSDSDSGSDAQASDSSETAAASGDTVCAGEVSDLLAEICDKGVLTVSTDPAYPPQSSLNEQTGEYEGFDIDVATEIAEAARRRRRAGRRRPGTSSPPAAGTVAGTPPSAR